MHGIDVWLFDLDGTLVDSSARFAAAYNSALAGRDLETVGRGVFDRRLLQGALLAELELPADAHEPFWDALMSAFVATPGQSLPIPGVDDALARLRRQGRRVAVVTARTCSNDALQRELDEAALAPHIDACFCIDDALARDRQKRPTKVDLFAAACDFFRIAPRHAAYVSDWPDDLALAHTFGFRFCIGVLTGGYGRDAFRKAADVFVIDSVAALVPDDGPALSVTEAAP